MSNTNLVVEVDKREERGTNASRRLRARGLVPGIVYGMGMDPFAITVPARRIDEVLHGEAGRNAILELALRDGDAQEQRAAMIKELTRDPVSGHTLHVDFVRVDLRKAVQVAVPIHALGEPAGVKIGGLLELVQREVHLECLPGDIPDGIDIDVTALEIGDQVHIREITVPDAVTVLDDPEQVLLHVVPPHVVQEEAAAEEGAEAAAEEGAEEGQAPAEATGDEGEAS